MRKAILLLVVVVMVVSSVAYAEVRKGYYDSGVLKFEWNHKDGKLNGITKIYYPSGQLQAETNFKDGETEGINKTYYESGQLQAEANFKDGKQEGIGKTYYESGQIMGELNYKDDKQEGIQKFYYENGQLSTEENFNNGKRHGLTKGYYQNGGIIYIDTYKNGTKTHRKKYDEIGKLEFEQDYPEPEQAGVYRKSAGQAKKYPYGLEPILIDKDGDGENTLDDWKHMTLKEKRQQAIYNLIYRARKDATKEKVDEMVSGLDSVLRTVE